MIKETCLNQVCLHDSLKIVQATFSSGEMSTVNVTSQDVFQKVHGVHYINPAVSAVFWLALVVWAN